MSNLQTNMGRLNFFTMLYVPIREHGMSVSPFMQVSVIISFFYHFNYLLTLGQKAGDLFILLCCSLLMSTPTSGVKKEKNKQVCPTSLGPHLFWSERKFLASLRVSDSCESWLLLLSLPLPHNCLGTTAQELRREKKKKKKSSGNTLILLLEP